MTDGAGNDIGAFARAFTQLMQDVHEVATGDRDTTLPDAIAAHLGVDPGPLSIVTQSLPGPDQPNLQLALERMTDGRDDWQIFGLPVEVGHWDGFGLANLATGFSFPGSSGTRPVAPAYTSIAIGVDETLPCVTLAVWLVHLDDEPVVLLQQVADAHSPMAALGGAGIKLEAMARERETAVAFMRKLRSLVNEVNVYRGKMLSYTFSEWGAFGLEFHRLELLTRDDLILPDEDLAAIERHAMGIAQHAEQLRAAGRHLKRGLLLYGPPGTGKTFSVQYLCSQMPERTTIIVSGQAAPTLGQAAALARSLQPSMLVLEDVDLVAMERTFPGMGSNPLLFQLLNEMDGLDDDADVLFILTTNRVELLEPALAARPGRVDAAVEIKLPDEDCRTRLLERYLRGMEADTTTLPDVVARTEGVSAAFLKELCRRAALIAAERLPAGARLVVSSDDLDAAVDDLLERSSPLLRATLGANPDGQEEWFGFEPGGFSGPPQIGMMMHRMMNGGAAFSSSADYVIDDDNDEPM